MGRTHPAYGGRPALDASREWPTDPNVSGGPGTAAVSPQYPSSTSVDSSYVSYTGGQVESVRMVRRNGLLSQLIDILCRTGSLLGVLRLITS